MMSSAKQQRFDDQVLIRYLLGSLPEKEAERLDELSIADDAFAWQLGAVENDLVDAFVRGELSGDNLAQFKESYLSSPKRLQRVEFADALRSFDAKTVTAAAQAVSASTVPSSKSKKEPSKGLSPSRWYSVPRLTLQWGFAMGVLAMLFAASYLLVENARLRKQSIEAEGSHVAFEQREQELQRQLNDQRAANAEMGMELDRLRQSQPNLDQLKTISTLLVPPTRGAGGIPTVLVPRGTGLVVLLLALEADDFPAYRVALKDPAANQIVWHSANLEATRGAGNKTVAVDFPARLLKQQNYVVELSGVSRNGRAEFISGYPIRVVIR
jgi:hypothetical protein